MSRLEEAHRCGDHCRPSTVPVVVAIVVMAKGRIVGRGTHWVLEGVGDWYTDPCASQFAGMET
ncbi:MAG: hypothetical protein KGR42_04465 [Acidobacteria bacterium]|nr:hypothetical protein [Acidobacteriota bacterium]